MYDLLAFPDTARVWIYQGDIPLPADRIGIINEGIAAFTQEWTSHNRQLRATGGLLHDRFLVLVADESKAGASGCSIDASVKFVKEVGAIYRVDFFDRLHFAYLLDDAVRLIHRDALSDAYHRGMVSDQTLFFDHLVKDKGAFLAHWVVPLSESWMKRFI